MPAVSTARRFQRFHDRLSPAFRERDLALEILRPDGSVVLRGGGVWDTIFQRYTASTSAPRRVRLVSSQLRAAEQVASWFLSYEMDDPDRVALEMYADMRRGGKTFFTVLFVLLFLFRYPSSHLGPAIGWIVVPTYPQQREIHEYIASIIPPEWFADRRLVYHRSDNYYEFCTGAQLWIKSADRYQTLKAGRISVIAANEAQQMGVRAILNLLGANIDSGGICTLAMNPPDSVKGLWAENLHDAIRALDGTGLPVLPFARETQFPSAHNEVINQAARTRFAKLAAVLDTKGGQRDGLGLWVSIKDRCYPFYNRAQHVRALPEAGWRDITADVNGLTSRLIKGEIRTRGAAMDFQSRPWCAFVEARVLLAPDGVWVPAGTPVYVFEYECTNDPSRGEWWTEELLCAKLAEEAEARNVSPKDYLLIADATGRFQGSSRAQRGKESDPVTWSWSLIRQFGWEPHAPIEGRKFARGEGPGRIIREQDNPPVPVRIEVTNQILQANRIVISTKCPELAESFRICEVKNKKPYGRGAHLTDCAGYLIYVWETALREAGIVKVAASSPG